MAAQARWSAAMLLLIAFLGLISCAAGRQVAYVDGVDSEGNEIKLRADRTPTLYTGDYGDCLGGESLFNVTKFDAALYADNFTVLFHLHGTTNLRKEDVVLHISVDAYGENRFQMTFDPCLSQVYSMCPVAADTPIEAWAIIPIAPADVEIIPGIALKIPDIEGTARLRVFANSSKTEIGCFQAKVKNGHTFSYPAAISPFLGIFAFTAMLSSFALAIYGYSLAHMRMHYAHAFSVLIVFEAYQSIFFSGALNVPWPSVLPAWWSNFAWAAGMIPVDKMMDSISPFAGISGNASQAGGAGSVTIATDGGLIQQIYGRALRTRTKGIFRRQRPEFDPDNPFDYTWGGYPARPGLPTPGSWDGFGGTLSEVGIPTSDAFMVALIWLVILLACLAFCLAVLKFAMDFAARRKWMREDRFRYFRSHLRGYTAVILLRTLLIAFFTMMTLAMVQFAIEGPPGPKAIAGIVFFLMLVGMGGIVAYACYFRLRFGRYEAGPDTLRIERGRLFKVIPFISAVRTSKLGEKEMAQKPLKQIRWYRVRYIDDDPQRQTVHEDLGFVKRFGWLSAHYRRTRWWFFAYWLAYQFIRACFIGGAVNSPLAQVFGIFVVECIGFIAIVKLNPFEGQRNMVMAVWMLSISKVATAGLSIGFLPEFGLSRIVYTVIGVIIIVIQGFLTVALLILVILGAISSWMSLTRNREKFPENMEPLRVRYFERMEARAPDVPIAKKKADAEEAEQQRPTTFNVQSVRRVSKIEDEDADILADLDIPPNNNSAIFSPTAGRAGGRSRTNSMSSRHSVSSLPRTARPHRASWSAKDFAAWDSQMERPDSPLAQQVRRDSMRRLAHARSQGSLSRVSRSSTPALGERPNSAMALQKRPPMTPALEMQEEQAMSSRNYEEDVGGDSSPEEGTGLGVLARESPDDEGKRIHEEEKPSEKTTTPDAKENEKRNDEQRETDRREFN